jgi:hypothetical protein
MNQWVGNYTATGMLSAHTTVTASWKHPTIPRWLPFTIAVAGGGALSKLETTPLDHSKETMNALGLVQKVDIDHPERSLTNKEFNKALLSITGVIVFKQY